MTTKLLPCPFCGSPVHELEWPEGGEMGRFCCSNFVGDCPACNLEATDSEWNKRALIGLTINKGNPHFEISQPAYCSGITKQKDAVLLAAPEAPRQEPMAWKTGSIIWSYKADAVRHAEQYEMKVIPLYAAPPSPDHSGGGAGMVLPEREVMRDLIAEVIGGDTYDCLRTWSAWGVGTMSDVDFSPLIESEERLYEIADACLDKVKELNQ